MVATCNRLPERKVGFSWRIALEKQKDVAYTTASLSTEMFQKACARCSSAGRECADARCAVQQEYKHQMETYAICEEAKRDRMIRELKPFQQVVALETQKEIEQKAYSRFVDRIHEDFLCGVITQQEYDRLIIECGNAWIAIHYAHCRESAKILGGAK